MMRTNGGTIISGLRRALGAGALADADDGHLLEQFVAHQDEAAFAALLRRHGPMVWGICQRLVAHQQDAEDCFQATFLVLCRKANSIGRSNLLANWLFGVARRAALNAQARRSRRARHETLYGELPDRPAAETLLWDDVPSVLDDELARLPSRYRLPLLLCGLEGMTHAQASKSLGWPVGTVAGRLSRGRELLRTRLLRRGVMAPGAVLPVLLIPQAAPACVPPQLVAASVRSAMALFMAGQSAPVEISATVASLVRGVLQKMLLHRVLTRSILAMVAALALGGVAESWRISAESYAPEPAGMNHPSPAPSNVVPAGPRLPIVKLSADPDAVVLRMDRLVDSAAGLGIRLSVFADGRVEVELPQGLHSLAAQDLTEFARTRAIMGQGIEAPAIKTVRGKIAKHELDELMRFTVMEQDFLTLSADSVKKSIEREYQKDWTVRDDTDTTTIAFTVQTADSKNQISWARLGRSCWNFPKVHKLGQLRAVERRLAHVYSVILAGGVENVDAIVDKLDAILLPYYKQYPQVPRLKAADLSQVMPAADSSSIRYGFLRPSLTSEFVPQFAASIVVPEHGEPFLDSVIPPQ